MSLCERAHAHIPLLPVPPRPAYMPYIPRTTEQLEMCVNVRTCTSHSCRSHHGQLIRHTSSANCRAAGNVCEHVHAHIPLLPVPLWPAYMPYIARTAEQLEMCVNVRTRTSLSCRSHYGQLIRHIYLELQSSWKCV